ncbi:sushi, von Willebrand factor type A, EGF and pentraxin domain-containing protein 1-like isoform X2 [Physella acuta]|uniref:sushi, von Willebrand factor type A, EGF and pentraxin domain-containing protein 1-like isoform X2 n=1 Tax=Physella acuta TaxID=109671 RepID=UPI0027DE9B57|nr:sushi, von Willebrand factor type A, EGF and pentraxin domain-containing protein 1-like isoform X2 [Physella acuta]
MPIKLFDGHFTFYLALYLLCTYAQVFVAGQRQTNKDTIEQGRQIIQDLYTNYSSTATTNPVDLVFVLDRSASVSRSGWESTLRFVQTFLEHFTVDADNTRVAIISYGTTASTDLDGIRTGDYNKCALNARLQNQIAKKVPAGYSATHAAILRAKDVLVNSRPAAKKAVVVITDGKSNIGPPPVRASIQLRSLVWDTDWATTAGGPQLQVYAVGIKDAYMPEVRTIASPLSNHTFYIPDFRAFAELARSLHDDNQTESWHVLSDKQFCGGLCVNNSYCACGTRSGQYLCVCEDGFHGDGLACTACPRGSYKNKISPSRCFQCPGDSTTLAEGATDISQCVCKPPFYREGPDQPCQMRTCPDLPDIAHGFKFHVGYVVRDEVPDTAQPCRNQPDTSCHFNCDTGYRLDGHPGLVCLANGTWEGSVPTCHIVDCGTLTYHGQEVEHGNTTYLNQTTTFGSVVQVTCHDGWRAFGDVNRTCTEQGVWSGTQTWCVENRCNAISLSPGLVLTPPRCGLEPQLPGSVCYFKCEAGYVMTGPSNVTCNDHGNWGQVQQPSCQDREPPVIKCPSDITVPITEHNYALVHWDNDTPTVSDNSGSTSVTAVGLSDNPAQMTAGHHQIKYVVQDKAGNSASCVQGITVVAFTVHLVTCPSGQVVINMSQHMQPVIWPDVTFVNNNNVTVPHLCTPANNSLVPPGTHSVQCVPVHQGAHAVHCQFEARVNVPLCKHPPPPLHGSLSCSTTASLLTCIPHCNENYDFHSIPQTVYNCDLQGRWNLRTPNKFWPDCSRKYYPNKAVMSGQAQFFYYGGSCQDVKDEIAEKFTRYIQTQSWNVCGAASCEVQNVRVVCGQASKRRRRSSGQKFRPPTSQQDSASRIDTSIKLMRRRERSTLTTESSLNFDIAPTKQKERSKFDVLGVTRELFYMDDIEFQNKGGAKLTDNVKNFLNQRKNGKTNPECENCSMIEENQKIKAVGSSGAVSGEADDMAGRMGLDRSTSVDGFHLIKRDSENSDVYSQQENRQVPAGTLQDDIMSLTTSPLSDSHPSPTQTSEFDVVENGTDTPLSAENRLEFELVYSLPGRNTTEQDQTDLLDHYTNISQTLKGHFNNLTLEETDPAVTQQDNTSAILYFNQVEFSGDPQLIECQPGYVSSATSFSRVCVACPPGSYYENDACVPCEVAHYQPDEGQLTCLPCPGGTLTDSSGANNVSLCVGECSFGEYSETGLEPCHLCPLNMFNFFKGSTVCLNCPDGKRTKGLGSKSDSDCSLQCQAGSYSETGLEPCKLCPLGQYQPEAGGKECLLCPALWTNTTGARNISDCIVPENACTDVRCENNGTCVMSNNWATCLCAPGYTGDSCESDVQDCIPNICQNDGLCVEGVNQFTCTCQPGFTGQYCEMNVDECMPEPCVNGGSCLDQSNGYRCYCRLGYTGANCETAVSLCHENTCVNGECHTNLDNTETSCVCQKGFAGTFCEIPIDPCSSSPCAGGATCLQMEDMFKCVCPDGLNGPLCQYNSTASFDLKFNGQSPAGLYAVFPEIYMRGVPNFTLCGWFRPDTLATYSTLVAFTSSLKNGTEDSPYLVTFSLRHTDKLIVSIFDVTMETDATLPPYVWTHLCFLWQAQGGHWQVAVNGSVVSHGNVETSGLNISTNVKVVIGQENPFHAEVSSLWNVYSGEISVFNIFSRIFTPPQLKILANQSACEPACGDIICWMDVPHFVKGAVIMEEYSKCLDVNECWFPSEFPCAANRECTDLVGNYTCDRCAHGFTGDSCTERADECEDDPCVNGMCVDGLETFDNYCLCHAGYTGFYCDILINQCLSSPCQNNGVCIPGENYFTCQCQTPGMGPLCERPASACLPNPCQNQGLCVEGESEGDMMFSCFCPAGYSGRLCEVGLGWCDENVCANGGSCVASHPRGANSTHFCRCTDGWMGRLCDVRMEPSCHLQPCLYGGTCVPVGGSPRGYACLCPDRPGVKLDENCGLLDPCDSAPCPNTTQCVSYVNMTYSCECLTGGCTPWVPDNSTQSLGISSYTWWLSDGFLTVVGLSAAAILAVTVIAVILCRKKKSTNTDLEVLSYRMDATVGHVTKPGFHLGENQTEESTYAELGDEYNIPESSYAVRAPDAAVPSSARHSIVSRSISRKLSSTSSGSFTSMRSSVSKNMSIQDDTVTPLLSDDYLVPVTLTNATDVRPSLTHEVETKRNNAASKLGVVNTSFNPENYIIDKQNRTHVAHGNKGDFPDSHKGRNSELEMTSAGATPYVTMGDNTDISGSRGYRHKGNKSSKTSDQSAPSSFERDDSL